MIINFLIRPLSMRRDLHKRLEDFFNRYMPKDAIVYDIGCGQKPFANHLKDKVSKHIGVDLADGFYKPEHVDLIGTAYEVPAPDEIADAIILSEVIEHLETPKIAIREAHRLLKNNGILFLSFPFLYPQHAPPRDFMRYTEFYLKQELLKEHFEIIELQRIGGFWYMAGQFISIYLGSFDRGIISRTGILKLLISITSLACLVNHYIEGFLIHATGKEATNIRAAWTLNYQVVCKKQE